MPKRPARIKISLNRPLSHSEIEELRGLRSYRSDLTGAKTTAHFEWLPHQGVFLLNSLKFGIKLSKNQQIYAESDITDSRTLYRQVLSFLEDAFVNIHPVAVKTLRERGVSAPKPSMDDVLGTDKYRKELIEAIERLEAGEGVEHELVED